MTDRTRYRTIIYDNQRWEGFSHRPGDIVICTPPKCGTTWTQMLCALLIFDGPQFPGTLDELSPWLDMQTRSAAEVHALLDAQTHRRFIKTHTPLDGLPVHPDVTYLIVGRDPRDVAVSFEHHMENLDFERFLEARAAAVGNQDLADFPPPTPPSEDPVERLRAFIEGGGGLVTLDDVLAFLQQGWRRRREPNVALFLFSDYKRDLATEIERLAAVLGVNLAAGRAASLAEEASLLRMRDRAHELAPDTTHNHWKDPRAFFRSGGAGEWRDRASEALLARYDERVASHSDDPDFVSWLHGGRSAAGAAFA
jgi:hypothetical protein